MFSSVLLSHLVVVSDVPDMEESKRFILNLARKPYGKTITLGMTFKRKDDAKCVLRNYVLRTSICSGHVPNINYFDDPENSS